LQEGRVLVEGTPDEIKNNPKVQEAYLGGVLE
jgi:branched-chain amino acid transport system permease protein